MLSDENTDLLKRMRGIINQNYGKKDNLFYFFKFLLRLFDDLDKNYSKILWGLWHMYK